MFNYKGLDVKMEIIGSCKNGVIYSYYNEKVGEYYSERAIKLAITKYLKKEGK